MGMFPGYKRAQFKQTKYNGIITVKSTSLGLHEDKLNPRQNSYSGTHKREIGIVTVITTLLQLQEDSLKVNWNFHNTAPLIKFTRAQSELWP